MKRIIIHQEPQTKPYKTSTRLSLSYLFVLACNVFTIIYPFYFWNNTLWTTRNSYQEQPNVSFLYKVIMVLQTTSTLNGASKEIYVSTLDTVNALRPDTFRMAAVQSYEEDTDLDGIIDWFQLKVDVPLNDDEKVMSMQTVAFFEYQLDQRVKLQMESAAYTSVDSNLPLSGYDTEGDLIFRQVHPLGVRGYKSTLYEEETPLVKLNSEVYHVSNSNIGDILAKYRTRDVAADYVERYPVSTMDLDTTTDENRRYSFKMKIRIPEQDVVYIPTLTEVLKDAWVKYVSVAILCWLVVDRVKSFVFAHHLI